MSIFDVKTYIFYLYDHTDVLFRFELCPKRPQDYTEFILWDGKG